MLPPPSSTIHDVMYDDVHEYDENNSNNHNFKFITTAVRFLAETASEALAASVSDNTTDDGNNATDYDSYLSTDGYDGDEYTFGSTKSSKDKAPIPLDYSVLSVSVLTLGLILFVEGCRHWLDHAAHGKPFFKGVLEMFYSELATLGLVEFFVFVIIKYYDDLDKEKKEVFGDVHFAIFYTAILNAFQSCLTALFTRRNSTRLWVDTEHLELDHYVEIREEYDLVEQLIHEEDSGRGGKIGKWIRNIVLFIRQPGLVSRYQELRVQIRFHELRLHFLESNNLPLNLKVSEYLKRSELGVLIHLVHVSATAWLFLTGGLNLMYFLCGMIGYATGDVDVVGSTLTSTFFALMFAFILVSLLLYYKMRTIFHSVIKTQIIESSDRVEGAKTQKNLFWFGSPHLVISIIQFMNFGYALALAIVIMYWPYLTGVVNRYWYLIAVFGCYSVFLYIISMVLPQYTLCTSLGYLVNMRELQSTVAMHRLEEAERQQRRRLIERAIENDSVLVLGQMAARNDHVSSVADNDSITGTQLTVSSVIKSSSNNSLASLVAIESKEYLLADLIKADTKNLRSQLPEGARESLVNREEQIKARRSSRKKSVSDGVALMRASLPHVGVRSLAQENAEKVKKEVEAMRKKRSERMAQRRASRKKAISQPGVIKGWQDITTEDSKKSVASYSADDTDAERLRKSSSDNSVIKAWQESHVEQAESGTTNEDDALPQWKTERAQKTAMRKHQRKKSVSASAVIQSWRDHSVNDVILEDVMEHTSATFHHGPEEVESDDGSEDYRITNQGKTIAVSRSRVEGETIGPKPPLFSLQDSFDLHPVMESEREYDISLRGIDDVEKKNKKVIQLSDAIILEELEPTHDLDQNVDVVMTPTDDDDKSIASDKSVGNLSAVDVFETKRGIITNIFDTEQLVPWHRRLGRMISRKKVIADLKSYFHGAAYPTISHVFGTLVIFFVIGHRVESMIAKTGVFFEAASSWGNNLAAAYWAEFGLLVCFLIGSILILTISPLSSCKSFSDRSLVLSSIFDLFLTTAVLTLLIVAEAQRCCEDAVTESLSSEVLLPDRNLGEIGNNYEFEIECTCASWGRRTYTGLGNIEPFTSIIVLRMFRFALARLMVRKYDELKGKVAVGAIESSDTSKENSADQNSSNGDDHGHDHGHGHGHGGHGEGTALELWERAILEFPDIVNKYGQFSSELLQAMLGLDVRDMVNDASNMSLTVASDNEKADNKKSDENAAKMLAWQSHIKLAGEEYSDLPVKAQGLIIAGRLGKPVKSMGNLRVMDVDDELPTVTEGTVENNEFGDTDVGLFEFEVDEEQMKIEKTSEYSFIAPFARLVRSMRRCDRRHFPLLKKWVTVDVVMTQFEIVYFEAVDQGSLNNDEASKKQKEACLPALTATKGGKGLRLCDIASGRRVVGHLDLSDVTEVHVEQDKMPLSDINLIERASALYDKEKDLNDEYWQTASGPRRNAAHHFARNMRWTTMKEDRLKLMTSHGTLYLRFFSDLAYADAEKSTSQNKLDDHLQKDIAFQWAQTIARICGTGQLRQVLPHYGEDNGDELRDYLQVVHFHRKEADEAQKVERGTSAVEKLERVFGNATADTIELESPKSPTKPTLNHARSFDDDLLQHTESERLPPLPPKPSFHRSISLGGHYRSSSVGGHRLTESEVAEKDTFSPDDSPDGKEKQNGNKNSENHDIV